MNRIRLAWKILTGRPIIPDQNFVYVRESKHPNQFVQLLSWRDEILALDSEGKIWEIRYHDSIFPTYQLLCESPSRSYK